MRNQSNQDPLNIPDQDQQPPRVAAVTVERGDGKPTAVAPAIFKDLKAELKVQTDRLAQIVATDVPAFNEEAKRAGAKPIEVKEPRTLDERSARR